MWLIVRHLGLRCVRGNVCRILRRVLRVGLRWLWLWCAVLLRTRSRRRLLY